MTAGPQDAPTLRGSRGRPRPRSRARSTGRCTRGRTTRRRIPRDPTSSDSGRSPDPAASARSTCSAERYIGWRSSAGRSMIVSASNSYGYPIATIAPSTWFTSPPPMSRIVRARREAHDELAAAHVQGVRQRRLLEGNAEPELHGPRSRFTNSSRGRAPDCSAGASRAISAAVGSRFRTMLNARAEELFRRHLAERERGRSGPHAGRTPARFSAISERRAGDRLTSGRSGRFHASETTSGSAAAELDGTAR